MTVIRTDEHLAGFQDWLTAVRAVDVSDKIQIGRLQLKGRLLLIAFADDVEQESNAASEIALSSHNIGRGFTAQWRSGREECLRVKQEVERVLFDVEHGVSASEATSLHSSLPS